jgi:transposase
MPLNRYYEGFPLDSFAISKSEERISLIIPDRRAATLETWLKTHPGVQLISWDRAGEFARGARQGAPEALQTADRFHVLASTGRSGRKSPRTRIARL